MKPLFRRQKSTEAAPATNIAKIGAAVTVLGTIFGGLWAFFQFSYTKWIEPRLSPAVVQIQTETHYVATSACCYLYEVTARLENKGKRDVVIHASHQVVAARRLITQDDTSETSVESMTQKFLQERSLSNAAKYQNRDYIEYIFGRPERPALLLSVGDIIGPGSNLAPGEIHSHRSIAAVPKDHLVMSIRGSLLVSHFPVSDIDWRWTVNKETLKPVAMPWKRGQSADLERLARCTTDEDTEAGRKQCFLQIANRAEELYRTAWASDPYKYTQSHAADLFVKPLAEPKK